MYFREDTIDIVLREHREMIVVTKRDDWKDPIVVIKRDDWKDPNQAGSLERPYPA